MLVPFVSPAHARRGDGPYKIRKALSCLPFRTLLFFRLFTLSVPENRIIFCKRSCSLLPIPYYQFPVLSTPSTLAHSRASASSPSVFPPFGTIPYTTLQPIASATRDNESKRIVFLGSRASS